MQWHPFLKCRNLKWLNFHYLTVVMFMNDELKKIYREDQLAMQIIELTECQNDEEQFRKKLLDLLKDIKEGEINVD